MPGGERRVAGRRPLTAGKVRGLATTSTPGGIFAILAIDHRDALRVVLDADDPDGVAAARLTDVKLRLLRGLAGDATAVMLDPEYSAAQAITSLALPGTVGFLAAVEAQGYLGEPGSPRTSLLDGWSVAKAKRLGANGIKLLVRYRPDAGEVTERQDATISAVIADCARDDVPLFLEPVGYAVEDELSDPAAFAAQRRRIVVESVRRLSALGPDVLKVQFPVDARREPDRSAWREACAELDEAADVPWALLSGGDPYELFRDQVGTACAAGASGFMVGRALWGDVVTAPLDRQQRLLTDVARPRLRELAGIAAQHGRSWADGHRFGAVDEHWYLTY